MVSNNKNKYKLRHYRSICKSSMVDTPILQIMWLNRCNYSMNSVCDIMGINYRTLRNYLGHCNINYNDM